MRVYPLFIIPFMTKIKQLFHQCYYHSDCPLPSVCCYGPVNHCCILPNKKLAYNYIKKDYPTIQKYKSISLN